MVDHLRRIGTAIYQDGKPVFKSTEPDHEDKALFWMFKHSELGNLHMVVLVENDPRYYDDGIGNYTYRGQTTHAVSRAKACANLSYRFKQKIDKNDIRKEG